MTTGDARFQGSIPEHYDRHLGPVIFRPFAEDLAARVQVSDGTPVLEVACGTGILTERLRAALPRSAGLVATDLNGPMIAHARTRVGSPGIEWKEADAAALPFPPASFGALACQFGFMFVPDKAAAFREARRVLMDGGLFAFNVWDGFENNAFGRIAHETIGSFFPSDPPLFYKVPFGFRDRDEIRRLLTGNRFDDIDMSTVKLEAGSDSARSFAIGLIRGNPVSLSIEERGGTLEPVIDRLADALARAGGESPFRSSIQALVVTARAA